MKKVAVPFLSTSFSENGRRAKKRFVNILDTKAKKTGFVLMLMIAILAAGLCMGFAFTEEQRIDMSMTELQQLGERSVGADMAEICYANDEAAIFYYSNGLFVFNMQTELMEQTVDLSGLGIPINTQGDETIDVFTSADGSHVYLTSQGTADKKKFVCWDYEVKSDSAKKLFTDYAAYDRWRSGTEFFTDFMDTVDLAEQIGGWLSGRAVNTGRGKVFLGLAGSAVKDIALYRITDDNLESYSPFNHIYLAEKVDLMNKMHSLFETVASETDAETSISAHLAEFTELSGGRYEVEKLEHDELYLKEPYHEIAGLADGMRGKWQQQIDALYSRSHELDLFAAADAMKDDDWFSNRPLGEPIIGGKATTLITGFYGADNHPQLVIMDLNLGNIFRHTDAPIFATRLSYYDEIQPDDMEAESMYDKGIYKPNYTHFAGHEIVEKMNNGAMEYYLRDNGSGAEYLVFRQE